MAESAVKFSDEAADYIETMALAKGVSRSEVVKEALSLHRGFMRSAVKGEKWLIVASDGTSNKIVCF